MFVSCEYLSLYYKFMLYVCECMFDIDCVCYFLYFCYNVICVNCGMCECVSVLYKYNIILYNLIIRKYRGFVTLTCVCIVIML